MNAPTQTDYYRQAGLAINGGTITGTLTEEQAAELAALLPTPAIRVAGVLGLLLERDGVSSWMGIYGDNATEAHLDFVAPETDEHHRVTFRVDSVLFFQGWNGVGSDGGPIRVYDSHDRDEQLTVALEMIEEAGVLA